MRITAAIVAALSCLGCVAPDNRNAPPPTITLDTATHFQTINGWEATAQAGQEQPGFSRFKDTVFTLAVDHLGINRLRTEIRSSAENSIDYWSAKRSGAIDESTWRCVRYATVNDDEDPNHINEAGFHWEALDLNMEQVVLPLKRRIEANGEKPYLNLIYVAFAKTVCKGHDYGHLDPEEYAEFVLAAVLHLKAKYDLVPDALEVILEPDNNGYWTNGTIVGRAIVAVTRRLKANGFNLEIIAPSTVNMGRALSYLDEIKQVQGAIEHVKELSYHRYRGVSRRNLRAIANAAARDGLRTAMLEHIGSGYENLHEDLEIGMNSAWQQYTLAFPTEPGSGDDGASYIRVDATDTLRPIVSMASRAKFLRQYFRYVRRGAVRIGANSEDTRFQPLAFINAGGRYAVVVKANGGGTFMVKGLPAGRYGISFTTKDSSGVGAATVAAGAQLSASIPAAGVITVFQEAPEAVPASQP